MDTLHEVPPGPLDREILRRAATILSSDSVWNRYDPTGHMCVVLANPDRPAWKAPKSPTDAARSGGMDGGARTGWRRYADVPSAVTWHPSPD